MSFVPGPGTCTGQDCRDASPAPAPGHKPTARPSDMKVMGPASPATTDRRAVPTVGHTPWNQRVRSLLLGPHGGGTTRRRASDAVRVCIAAVLW